MTAWLQTKSEVGMEKFKIVAINTKISDVSSLQILLLVPEFALGTFPLTFLVATFLASSSLSISCCCCCSSRPLFLSGGGGGAFNDLCCWVSSRDSDPNVTSFRSVLVLAIAVVVAGKGGLLAVKEVTALTWSALFNGVLSFLFLCTPPMLLERISRIFCSRCSKLKKKFHNFLRYTSPPRR